MISSNILKKFEKVRSFVDQRSASTAQGARNIARVGACLSTLEGILKGSSSFSPFRRHAVAFSIAASLDPMILQDVISTDELLAVEGYLKDLNHFAAIEETLYLVCDCSFLYFYRDLFLAFVQILFKSSQGSAVSHTQAVLSALSDPERILSRVRHLDRNSSGLTSSFCNYQSFVSNILYEHYVQPISELIETDLRCVCAFSFSPNFPVISILIISTFYTDLQCTPRAQMHQKEMATIGLLQVFESLSLPLLFIFAVKSLM
jgi:hypothetical protein